MRWTAIPLSLIVFGLLFFLFRQPGEVEVESATPQGASEKPGAAQPTESPVVEQADTAKTAGVVTPAQVILTEENVEQCMSGKRPRDNPHLAADMARFIPYSVTSESILAYRGLSASELEVLTEQNDAEAMAVLGARNWLLALGIEDDDPAEHLSGYGSVYLPGTTVDTMSEESRAYLDEAVRWYYESALHGRYEALAKIGALYQLTGQDAVSLGWLRQSDFDGMTREERQRWGPRGVYNELFFSIAAETADGPAYQLAGYSGLATWDAEMALVGALFDKFSRDVSDRGQRIISVEPWQGPSLEEILLDMCPEVYAAPGQP